MDVWEDTTGGDGNIFHEFGKLLIVSDGELDVSWDNSWFLGIFGGVTGELKDLSGEVLKDGSKINWGTGSDSISVLSLLEESGNSSDWELESSSGSLGDWSVWGILSFTSSTFSGHFDMYIVYLKNLRTTF